MHTQFGRDQSIYLYFAVVLWLSNILYESHDHVTLTALRLGGGHAQISLQAPPEADLACRNTRGFAKADKLGQHPNCG